MRLHVYYSKLYSKLSCEYALLDHANVGEDLGHANTRVRETPPHKPINTPRRCVYGQKRALRTCYSITLHTPRRCVVYVSGSARIAVDC